MEWRAVVCLYYYIRAWIREERMEETLRSKIRSVYIYA
jgi:hypothetical protein